MKFTIDTETFKDLVVKSAKGASNNKMMPLTGLLFMTVKDNVLTMITTDSTNILYVTSEVNADNFRAVVPIGTFSKLISKLTCSQITLNAEDNVLHIIGNGNYSIEMVLDEDGELVAFPVPTEEMPDTEKFTEIPIVLLKKLITTLKPALSTSLTGYCYRGYYLGKTAIASDTSVITNLNTPIFDTPVLVHSETLDLIDTFSGDTVYAYVKDSTIILTDKHCTVYSELMDSISEYDIKSIGAFLSKRFDRMCTMSRKALLQVLDRIILFVGPYDRNQILLNFTKDGLNIVSRQSNCNELIPFDSATNLEEFTCFINVNQLYSQVKANTAEVISIYYGEKNAIKLSDEDVTQIIGISN